MELNYQLVLLPQLTAEEVEVYFEPESEGVYSDNPRPTEQLLHPKYIKNYVLCSNELYP